MPRYTRAETIDRLRRIAHYASHIPLYALLGAVLLLGFLAFTGPASAAPAAPTLDLTAETDVPAGQSVRPGARVTVTLALATTGGSGPVTARLTGTLPPGLSLAGRPTLRTSPGQAANPMRAQRRGRTVGWQGQLANGATLFLDVPVQVDHCWNGFRDRAVAAEAQRPDGSTLQAETTLRVHCKLASLDDIQVTQRILQEEQPAWAPYLPVLVPGKKLVLRTSFRNDAPVPVLLGVTRARVENPGSASLDAARRRIRTFWLQPGQVRHLDQTLRVGQGFSMEQLLDGEAALESNLIVCLLMGGERTCSAPAGQAQGQLPTQLQVSAQPAACGSAAGIGPNIPCPPDPGGDIPEPTDQVTMTIPVRPNDLGDAPDSSNHAGLTMAAYSGVTARFPTVFSRLPGQAAGPLHRHPRPVHLGPGVSMEAEADAGPDADPTNNLLPAQGVADRDRFDDGLKRSSITLNHCQPARMQVRVGLLNNQAKQALLDRGVQVLYLNVWVDGNRDGDWNDAGGPCSQDPSDLALEHIVIDHPVSVGQLTPGNNLVSVVSNVKALWPADRAGQPAWLRVTLSEAKSPKLLNRSYGDGRGPATGYRLGETEDYLLRPAGSPDPQVSTHVELGEESGLDPSGGVRSEERLRVRVAYSNQGNAPAEDVRITQALADPSGLEFLGAAGPGLDPDAVRQEGNDVVMELGRLEPGEEGSLVVTWRLQPQSQRMAARQRFTATATIASAQDVEPGNNSSQASAARRPSLAMGFRTAGSPVRVRRGATCRNTIQLEGRSTPGVPFHLTLDGADTGLTVTPGPDGRWQQAITGLSDGRHVMGVWVEFEGGDPDYPIEAGTVAWVDSSLPVDPASFTVTDGAGRVFAPGTLGANWGKLVLSGKGPYQLGITACTSLDQVTLTYIGETEKNVTLTDPDGDGRFTGILDLGARARAGSTASLSLTARSGDQEVTFDTETTFQAEGQVLDAATGQPLVGATVLLLREDGGASLALDPDFGQANPQTSGGDGGFLFAPPPGDYRLLVTAAGYQPFRSLVYRVNDEPVAPTIRLEPVVSQEPDVVVALGEAGYDPAQLRIPPGTVVEWVNGELEPHTVTGEGGAWDSGALLPGERFRRVFIAEGSFAYGDGENPLSQGKVTVDPSAPPPGTRFLYLPVVSR